MVLSGSRSGAFLISMWPALILKVIDFISGGNYCNIKEFWHNVDESYASWAVQNDF